MTKIKWQVIPCSWIERIDTVKMSTLPKLIHKFNGMCIEISLAFFTEIEKKNPVIHMGTQRTTNSQSHLEKEEQSWKHHIS